jgi:hypothetical protein
MGDLEDLSLQLNSAVAYNKFDQKLHTEYDKETSTRTGNELWVITKSFKYYIGDPKDNKWAVVPEGFVSDGASSPRIVWSWIPRWGLHGQACVLHDYLCRVRQIYINGIVTYITRKEADRIFLEALKVSGVNSVKRRAMYLAVRTYAKVKGLT